MNPELIRAKIAEAIRHHQAGQLTDARRLYEHILAVEPRQADALNLLGMIEHAAGNHALAVSRIKQAIAINPRVSGFHTNLGTVLHAQGDNQAAIYAFRDALAIKPDHLAALYNLGVALQALAEHDGAVNAFMAALNLNPRLRDAWNNMGNCQARLGDAHAALQSFERAMRLDPRFAAAQINAAGLLLQTGQFEKAEWLCRELIKQDPHQAEAHNNLGLVLMKCNRVSEAAAAFRCALAAKPDYDGAALNLGNALLELGEQDRAIAQYRALVDRTPENATPRLALAVTSIPMMPSTPEESGRVPKDFALAMGELDRWCSSHPGALASAAGTVQPFLLAYRPSDVTAPLAQYGRLLCREAALRYPASEFPAPALVGRSRARLGIVSGQVRNHPVWQVILRGIIERIDRQRFDVRLYNTNELQDEETLWAEARVDHHQRQPLSVEGWADHIRFEAPDILLYPEVGMNPVVGALAPLRLARLQVASWGHPVTTGLPSMDLYLSGDAIEPPDGDTHYTERLIRLPGTGVSTHFGTPQAHRWSGPDRQAGHVRFALCQQPMKFDPKDDALLARIAKEVGPSEFWIVQSTKQPWAGEMLVKRLASSFVAEGLDPARHLRVAPWMRHNEFLGFLDAMDAMLDCPAFSGYTTAWYALHRGTPIVTMEGRFMRQRLAAGLLRQVGHTQGIARNADDYVGLALEFADRSRSEAAQHRYRCSLAEVSSRADGNAEAITALQQVLLAG